jgi:hypothetical protein
VRTLSADLAGVVNVGLVDCAAHGQWCQQALNIPFYPFLQLYPPGKTGAEKAAGATPVNLDMQAGMPAAQALKLIGAVARVLAPRLTPAKIDSPGADDEGSAAEADEL